MGNKRIRSGKLSECIYGYSKLTEAEDADAKLGDGYNPYANCPMAMMPFATTGILFGRYLNDI